MRRAGTEEIKECFKDTETTEDTCLGKERYNALTFLYSPRAYSCHLESLYAIDKRRAKNNRWRISEAPEIISEENSDTPINNSDWLSIYSAVLSGENELGIGFLNYDIGDESYVTKIRQYCGYSLYDLDKNGTSELFVSIWLWEGGFYHLFTIDGGAVKYIGEAEGDLIEKSTGILFGVAGESGYTPDIAYEYIDNSLTEIPGYVQSLPATPEKIMPK